MTKQTWLVGNLDLRRKAVAHQPVKKNPGNVLPIPLSGSVVLESIWDGAWESVFVTSSRVVHVPPTLVTVGVVMSRA